MRTLIVLGLLLSAAPAFGQDGLRSPVLPEAGPFGQPPASRDIYTVPPDFYNRPTPPGLPTTGIGGFWVGSQLDGLRSDERRRDRAISRAVRAELQRQQMRMLTAPLAPVAPVVMPPPGPPKTFYIIDGCYAGDTRPDRTRLPERCRGTALRIVPPS